MQVHELKSWPDYFAPILDGSKNFEVRINDRGFNVGDIVRLREYDDRKGIYTGREIKKKITYILAGIGQGGIAPLAGIHSKYCVLALSEP